MGNRLEGSFRCWSGRLAPPAGAIVMRPATGADAPVVAIIWHRDGHQGHVSDELVSAQTEASFRLRASQRVADTTVATVDGAVAGFIMVVEDGQPLPVGRS